MKGKSLVRTLSSAWFVDPRGTTAWDLARVELGEPKHLSNLWAELD